MIIYTPAARESSDDTAIQISGVDMSEKVQRAPRQMDF